MTKICPDCGEENTPDRAFCGHCGRRIKSKWFPAIVVAVAVLALAFFARYLYDTSSPKQKLSTATPATTAAACSASDIKIKSMKARFHNACRTRDCISLRGVAVLTNTCSMPIGVAVKITALDASGQPVATKDLWPASTANIPPGDFTFSLDHWLEYQPEMATFTLEPVRVQQW